MSNCYCEKCTKTMDEKNFYTYKNGDKTELCKSCLTMHVDNFDPNTFLWILEKMDVPYIPAEWDVLRDRAFAKNPKKMNGTTVLGRYLSKMKLKQFNKFGWADSEALQEEYQRQGASGISEEEEEELRIAYENGEISEAQYKTFVSSKKQIDDYNNKMLYSETPTQPFGNPFDETQFVISQDDLPNPADELTDEDKIYLAMKWGTNYRPSDWVALEKTYVDMSNSFDIQDADSINTLLLICKTNLKMNQSIDSGDIEGYQKLSKVYNELRKTAKFTAAQHKEEEKDFVDCVGNLVAYCEKEGGAIPRYDISKDLDIVDSIIKDLKKYTKDLIYEDTALARQIEDYVKKREIAEMQKEDKKKANAEGFDEYQLTDEDFAAYQADIERAKQVDALFLNETTTEGEDEE